MVQKILPALRRIDPMPVLLVYFGVGVAGILIPATREFFVMLTPFSLLLSLFLLFLHHTPYTLRFWAGWVLVFLLGYILEVLGIATGQIFGSYQYGTVLGPRILHTPVLIGANWVLLVYTCQVISFRFIQPVYYRAIAAASLMVVYDFALEPAAMKMGMWTWEGGAVPLQNYIAWFLCAFILNYLAGRLRIAPENNRAALPLFFIQLGFFIVLDVFSIFYL